MVESMQKKHQKVFDLLNRYHKQNPENFFFTMRQINRANRLDEGYWFHGNDGYLAVSFWSGRDWMNKTPRISFTVWESGLTSLILSQKDTDTNIFSDELIKVLNVNSDSDKLYWKNYDDLSLAYLDSIEDFIINDKKEIDRLIRENRALVPGPWMEYANTFDFIRKDDFTKNLNRIYEYQERRKHNRKELGYITGFRIQNYGLIDDVATGDLPRDNRWIFLTGENGAGKTTILRALSIGIMQNTDGKEPIDKDGSYTININLSGEGKNRTNVITKNNFNPDNDPIVDAFAAYGPIRLITESSLDPDIFRSDIGRSSRLTSSLFNPIGILSDLGNHYPLFEKPKYMQMSIDNLLENLREIVQSFEFVQLVDKELLFHYYDHVRGVGLKSIPFRKLPSGTRNYVSLIIDLLIRFQRQQPNVGDMANYRGVVIIDEIDIHLHPKLQIEIIKQLSETFPKVQFIVTTHSPVALLGAPKNSVFFTVSRDDEDKDRVRLERMDKKIPVHRLLPNALLSSPLFDLDDITPVDSKISELITGDNYEDALLEYLLMKRYNLLKSDL